MSRFLDRLNKLTSANSSRCPARAYLDRLDNEHSRRAMVTSLRRAVMLLTHGESNDPLAFDWSGLTAEEVEDAKFTMIAQDVAPRTVAHVITAIKQVAKEAHALGLVFAEELLAIQRIEVPKPRRTDMPREPIAEVFVAQLLSACDADDTPAGVRDAAMIALAVGSGLRRGEITAAQFGDYRDGSIMVHGYRGRIRVETVSRAVAERLGAWIELRGRGDGPLFVPVNKGGKVVATDKPLSGQAYGGMLAKRCEEANIQLFTPDELYAASRRIQESADIAAKLDEIAALVIDNADPLSAASDDNIARFTTRILNEMDRRVYR